MKFNAVSQDFPLKCNHVNVSPIKPKDMKSSMRIFNDIKNGFNNESPDFFRIDSMNENKQSYKNPYLGEVIQEDRNLFFKNTNKTRELIQIIERLKCRKEYSQDPKYLKCVTSNDDMEIINKRNKINLEKMNSMEKNNSPIVYYKLDKNTNHELFDKKAKQLHYEYSPKHHYLVKKSIDTLNTLDSNNNDALTNLKLTIDPKKSASLKNYNDYNIRENCEEDGEKFLKFKKKEVDVYNCLLDTHEKKSPGNYVSKKWGSFYEK
jgi:hypothetical protein